MIFSSLNEGDKVIVERNCHRSILNALIMRKAVPIYVQNVVDTKINAPGALDLEHF
jgi:Arginine/lysine/ornithine decarboxylases